MFARSSRSSAFLVESERAEDRWRGLNSHIALGARARDRPGNYCALFALPGQVEFTVRVRAQFPPACSSLERESLPTVIDYGCSESNMRPSSRRLKVGQTRGAKDPSSPACSHKSHTRSPGPESVQAARAIRLLQRATYDGSIGVMRDEQTSLSGALMMAPPTSAPALTQTRAQVRAATGAVRAT